MEKNIRITNECKALAAVCLNAQACTKPAYIPQEREGVDYVLVKECE